MPQLLEALAVLRLVGDRHPDRHLERPGRGDLEQLENGFPSASRRVSGAPFQRGDTVIQCMDDTGMVGLGPGMSYALQPGRNYRMVSLLMIR